MESGHRDWLSLSCILVIVLLALAAATACASHPDAHDVAHPPLCIHSGSPAAQGHDKPILFVEDGVFPFPPKFLVPVISPAAMSARLPLTLALLPQQSSGTSETLSVSTPCMLLAVLRL